MESLPAVHQAAVRHIVIQWKKGLIDSRHGLRHPYCVTLPRPLRDMGGNKSSHRGEPPNTLYEKKNAYRRLDEQGGREDVRHLEFLMSEIAVCIVLIQL